jgi:hypothetical protein
MKEIKHKNSLMQPIMNCVSLFNPLWNIQEALPLFAVSQRVCEGAEENQQIWSDFLRHLKQRSLNKAICQMQIRALEKFFYKYSAQWNHTMDRFV